MVGAGGSTSDRYAVDARRVVFKSDEVACIVLFEGLLGHCLLQAAFESRAPQSVVPWIKFVQAHH